MADGRQTDVPESGTWRRWLVGMALGVLVALLALPATRWMLLEQLRWQFSAPKWEQDGSLRAPAPERAAAARVAASQSADYLVQLGAAMQDPQPLAKLEALVPRFPDQPSLYANILRMMCREEVRLRRPEESSLTGEEVPRNASQTAAADGERLAAFDSYAVAGARLDPENAYFPLMRAGGLFAAHRDEEAVTEILHAGRAPRYDDYWTDEAVGDWRSGELAGYAGAIPEALQMASVVLPHYSLVRSTARMAVYEAVRAEEAGRTEDGFAIRRAVARSGGAMRSDSRSLIGSLVGIAVMRLVETRPGGVPAVHRSKQDDRQRQRAALDTYCGYLTRIGHPEEACWMRAETEAAVQVRAITSAGASNRIFDRPLARLTFSWAMDLFTLANLLWLLAAGALGALLARSRRVREGRPLAGYVAWGAAAGALSAAAGIIAAAGYSTPAAVVVSAAGLALLGVVVYAVAFRKVVPARFAATVAVTWAGLLAAGFLVLAQTVGLAAFQHMARNFLGFGTEAGDPPSLPLWIRPGALAFAVAVPLLAACVFAISSRILRVPVSVGLARGFRGAAVPLACLLFLSYGCELLVTARRETQMRTVLRRTLQHEGRYYAAQTGLPWPGVTPATAGR